MEEVIICGNGQIPPCKQLSMLCRSNPLIVGCDGALSWLMSYNIIPDVLIGDFDSLTVEIPSSVEVIKQKDQLTTDTEKALLWASKNGYQCVHMTGSNG